MTSNYIQRHYERSLEVVSAHKRFVTGHSKAVDSATRKSRLITERAVSREVKRTDELRSRCMNEILEQFENSNHTDAALMLSQDNPNRGRLDKAMRALNGLF